uniref:MI domain-containing protein n=1 Tax=Angiostrongylus cantonensis TaxID=6313 RepID=A0A0K0DBH8_ANGCA
MLVVKSGHNGSTFSSRKQDRKRAKRLKKLGNVAAARHQPVCLMSECLFLYMKSNYVSKYRLEKERFDSYKEAGVKKTTQETRRRKRFQTDDESDSDADLTYEQYLKEVQDKKRKLAMERDDEKQDDIEIHRYSKLLGIKEGVKARMPKSFSNDGLDYLLDFCDSGLRKSILASSTDQEIALKVKIFSTVIKCALFSRKTGQVVSLNLTGARKKLEGLDAKNDARESKIEIDRILVGTMNRLSEGTLVKSSQVVSEMWQKFSKNDVKACISRALSRLICVPYRLQDQLLSLYALFLAYVHISTSDEISAYFVEDFLRRFIEDIWGVQPLDDKKLENCVVFIAHLLNFHVSLLLFILEVFEKLREHLNVDNLQLIVVLATCMFAKFTFRPRAKFLGESLLALQKCPPTDIDTSIFEHHLKLFYGLRKKDKSVSDKELGMSLDDILNADERGRWWIVGSAYQVPNEGTSAMNTAKSSQIVQSFPDDIVKLARKAKMNTDVRRNIFCIVATAVDEDSAFEQLLRLSLKGQQEREIIYVLIAMLLGEKNFNTFYPLLIARFCDFNRRFVLTTQYALWDRIKEIATLKTRSRSRLADLIHYLISHEVVSITVFKVVEWGTLSAAVSSVIRRVFKLLSSCPIQKLHRIFSPIFVKDKNPLLSEGLRLFLSVNFPDSETYRKIEKISTGVC